MATTFLHINVSVDGFICDPSGQTDWRFADEEVQGYIDEVLESIDGMVFGRRAFDELAAYWPTAGDEVSATQRRLMHELPKYVLTHQGGLKNWHNSYSLGSDPAAVRNIQCERGLAVFAGADAAQAFLAAGALDELRLIINPALLGGGIRLFSAQGAPADLRLRDTRTVGSGAAILTYAIN
jgi:dihydrofolate reductase